MLVEKLYSNQDGKSMRITLPNEDRAWVTLKGYKMGIEVNLHWLQDSDLRGLMDICQQLLDEEV